MIEYIEREAAILTPVLPKEYRKYQTDNLDDAYEQGWEDALDNLKNTPAADVAPVALGLWMPAFESEMTGWYPAVAGCDPICGYICSACKEEAVYDCNDKFVLSNYCPNCGAKMDGGAE